MCGRLSFLSRFGAHHAPPEWIPGAVGVLAPGGVLAIDTGFMRARMACSYLLEAGMEVAFIETGANSGVGRR